MIVIDGSDSASTGLTDWRSPVVPSTKVPSVLPGGSSTSAYATWISAVNSAQVFETMCSPTTAEPAGAGPGSVTGEVSCARAANGAITPARSKSATMGATTDDGLRMADAPWAPWLTYGSMIRFQALRGRADGSRNGAHCTRRFGLFRGHFGPVATDDTCR